MISASLSMYKPYPTVKNKWDKPVITCYYYLCYNAYVLFIATPVSFVINDSVVGFVFWIPIKILVKDSVAPETQ